ncbi:MAG: hypothetical protein GPI99_06995 [Microcystis aeruginosa W13-15]|nr:hypothetical protein [Microcystis aeruginosa W13-16]NCQ73423.1 hypothetical protein [Microcystis aeruginosa W13-13]NCQ77917.1 hypothetical protein [Microcystis aeruginosa W13-15]
MLSKSVKVISLVTQVAFLSIGSIGYISSNPAQAADLNCPPPPGTPKDGDADGDGKNDWFFQDSEQIDKQGNKVQIWCLDKNIPSFGYRYVPKNGQPVWAGACLFMGGKNRYSKCKNPLTGEFFSLDWKNVDDDDDDDPTTPGRDDWKWVYDIPSKRLLTIKTLDGKPVAQRIGSALENFNDITFGSSPLSNNDSNPLPMVLDPVISLVNISSGSTWQYGLLTPPGYPDRVSDQSLMVTQIKAGDSLFINGGGIMNPSVTGKAVLSEFGAWELTFLRDDLVSFTATQDAIIQPDTLIDGFQFVSANPAGQIQWITNGEEICYDSTIIGPVSVPESSSVFSLLSLGFISIGSTLLRQKQSREENN